MSLPAATETSCALGAYGRASVHTKSFGEFAPYLPVPPCSFFRSTYPTANERMNSRKSRSQKNPNQSQNHPRHNQNQNAATKPTGHRDAFSFRTGDVNW